MFQTQHPREIADREFDGGSFEIPPQGVSLKSCSFRGIGMTGQVIAVWFAKGCSFQACEFTGTGFRAGYFGGGEAAGFLPTVYRECCFDRSDLNGMSFG